jgi:hypothetical protein
MDWGGINHEGHDEDEEERRVVYPEILIHN